MSADLKDQDTPLYCSKCNAENHVTIDTMRYCGSFECTSCDKMSSISDSDKVDALLHFVAELLDHPRIKALIQ